MLEDTVEPQEVYEDQYEDNLEMVEEAPEDHVEEVEEPVEHEENLS